VLSSVLISAILDFVLVNSPVVSACVYIEVRNLLSSASSAFLSLSLSLSLSLYIYILCVLKDAQIWVMLKI
jgi:hypothetical protein